MYLKCLQKWIFTTTLYGTQRKWLLSHFTDKETEIQAAQVHRAHIRTLTRTQASSSQPVIFSFFLPTVGKMTKLYGSNQSILVGVYIFIYSCRRIWNFTHKKNNLQTSLLHGLFLWTSALVLFGLIMKSNAGWRYVIFKCICFTVKIWHATTNGCGFRRKCSCCIGHKVVSFFMIGED